MEVRDKVADTPVRQFDVSCRYDIDSPSTRNHHRPRTNQEGVDVWWPVARYMGVHADSMHMLKLTMCHPDANRVHIKITRYTTRFHIMKPRIMISEKVCRVG